MRRFPTAAAPHSPPLTSVSKVMGQVLLALVPATIAYVWYFGWGIVINMVIAAVLAVGFEASMLRVRGRPVRPHLADLSAVVTAVLLAFALPPVTPWWVTAVGIGFAIVFAKHLYGGLGSNPFNPAMAGYVVLLISFPVEMTTWLPPRGIDIPFYELTFDETLVLILTGSLPAEVTWDAISAATPLDDTKTGLSLMRTVVEIRASPLYGDIGGHGWEWINNWIALGGFWLLYKGVIRWHIPVAMLGALVVTSTFFFILDPGSHASPAFHVFAGAAILGAFFIATDPVSAATSVRGRLIYGVGIGVLVYVIRAWGGYPDGVAFAVLIMNLAVPAIDYVTIPRAYGHGRQDR